ncbi:hypothetical protein ACET3Z_016453 [Daucus carota]
MKGRFPTEEDMKGIEHKLPFMSKFDILVEVCRVASELYDQENKSNEGEELFKRGLKRVEGESSSGFRGNAGRSGSGLDRGKKRKYYGFEDFEVYEKKERVLGKKRTYCGPKDEDFEYSVERKKARKNNFKVRARVVEAAPLPGEFAAEILRLGGNDVKLLIQKNITATDLNASENRFSIPVNQLREEGKDFLTEDEEKTLDRRNAGNGIVPIPVRVLEPNLKRSFINFKKWPMNNSFCYVLCGSWTVMQKNNRLQANTELQVWSFRVNGELNLALVKVPKI